MSSTSGIPELLVESTNFNEQELQRLLARFIKLDKDSSGSIEKEEFLTIPAIASNPLAHRLMEVFDADGDGHVDFGEFISALSAFSSRGKREEKLKFAFNVYDIDRDGKLSNGELFIVLKAMVGTNLSDDQLQQIVDKTIIEADEDGDGALTFEEFLKAVDGSAIANSLTLNSF